MSSPPAGDGSAQVRAVRRGAGLFRLTDRALLCVRGEDRVRFLQGQLSNDVAALDPAGRRAGCHALALTREGRIVADLHVLVRPDRIWLDTDAVSRDAAVERLAKFVIADDVRIEDATAEIARFAVEGPRAEELLAAAAGAAVALAPEEVATCALAGAEAVVAAWGWSGEAALQLYLPREAAEAAFAALRGAAERLGASVAGAEALEVLRVEAGLPRAGAELAADTLPAEARLVERAVSFTKGCYTGQEVVARMASRGRVGHRLVGLAFEGDALPEPGAAIAADDVRVGAVTSVAHSPHAGAIALGFVRAGRDEPGTALTAGALRARVVELPFVQPGAA